MTKVTIINPEAVLKELSSEEKIALLSGDDMWHTVAVPRLGVPRVRCSDGPVSDWGRSSSRADQIAERSQRYSVD